MDPSTNDDRLAFAENLAAELTNAAYPVALRHGVRDCWLDLELDIWKALLATIKRLEQAGMEGTSPSSSPAPSPKETLTPRAGT